MKMIIIATTDGHYLGHEFDSADNPIRLAYDVAITVERVINLPDGLRFVSSSYIIDAKGI